MEGFKPQDFSFFHCGEKLVQREIHGGFKSKYKTLRKTTGNGGFSTVEPPSTVKTREIKMRRGLYTSNYSGIPAYLMDFGFGGFIGFGKGVSVGLVMEELNR